MSFKTLKIITALTASALIWSCGKKEEEDNRSPNNLPSLNLTKLDDQTKELLNIYCVGCHAGATPQKGVLLDSLESAKKHAPQAQKEVAEKKMPPKIATAQPNDTERQILVEWFTNAQK